MIKEWRQRIRMKFLAWLVKDLYNGIMVDDVFQVAAGEVHLNGEKITKEQKEVYRDEALKILHSEIWKEVVKQLQLASNKRMYEKSETTDDMFFGKAMLYNLDLLNKYLNLLSKLK